MSRPGSRLGFPGILAILAAVSLATASGGLFLATGLLGRPDLDWEAAPNPGASLRVQHVLAQVVLRQGGLSRDRDPLVLTTSDVNAFIARHVRVRDLPAWPPVVRLADSSVTLAGQTSPRRLLEKARMGGVLGIAPSTLLDLDIWLVAHGRVTVHAGLGELEMDGAAIGRQRIPVGWLWRLVGARPAELLVWRMPPVVERLEILPGRMVIHTRGG